ncbi:MAG TPA: family 78 glycoside hydrolase catalytic domain [Acidimicrobiales bacterium]|nr:family 78 glycoside hydrolase catalytic domain [Acidimicrobiales bacterium]
MSRSVPSFGRRAFLGSGVALSAGAVAAGPLAGGGAAADTDPLREARLLGSAGAEAIPGGPVRAGSLTVNGLVEPVGVDPDDCSFAWTLSAPGRQVVQTASRIVVRRTDPGHAGVVWDSGPVLTARQAFVTYAGPPLAGDAAYSWTVQLRGYAERWGQVSRAARFNTALRDADWQAHWLTPAGASQQPDRITYLRTEITPPAGSIVRATIYASAAHTYQLYVGGERVDAWPSFSYPDEQYQRAVDVTRLVAGGRASAVGALHRWYGAGKGRPASAPGLIVQLSLWYSSGRNVVVGTDGSWREAAAEWLPAPQRNNDACDYVEWVDGRRHPTGWSQPGYDDSAWSAVTVLGPAGTSPFTRTYPQRTRIVERVVAPVGVRTLASGSVVVDFGAVYAARPQVAFHAGQAGRTVAMRVGYLLDPDGEVSTTHGTQVTNLTFSYIQRGGTETFEAICFLGFRYLQIDGAGELIGADQVAALARHAAMPDMPPATFATGVRTLDAVWKLNARSCLYCCHEQFVDTPTREKAQFLWDAANESEAIMRAYGDQNMSWQGVRDVARGQARFHPDGRVNVVYPYGFGARDIPTFTERYPEWLWRYYVSTGDLATAVLLYPSAAKVSDYLWSARQAGTGLLYGLADVPEGDPTYGYDLGVAADTVSNVLAINAFNRTASLAQLARDSGGAVVQQQRSAALTAAVNAQLARADGVYVDGVDANGAQSTHASQEANALALAYAVVPAERVGAVGAYVASLGLDVGPNHGLELLRALAAAGRPDDMVHVLTDRSVPGWAHVLAAGGTFTWETWTPSDLIGDSMSHGWGSSALVAMQETLLGVSLRPPNPDGTVRLTVAPPAGGPGRAAGSVPTIAGPVTVSWQRRAGGRGIVLDLTVPANASALVHLPATDASRVQESGVAAGRAPGVSVYSVAGGMAVLEIPSGTYRFSTS